MVYNEKNHLLFNRCCNEIYLAEHDAADCRKGWNDALDKDIPTEDLMDQKASLRKKGNQVFFSDINFSFSSSFTKNLILYRI
jgi:hypothetical protein